MYLSGWMQSIVGVACCVRWGPEDEVFAAGGNNAMQGGVKMSTTNNSRKPYSNHIVYETYT